MAGVYVDTSALGRLLLAEPEADAIRGVLAEHDAWWSSEMLVVERDARRRASSPRRARRSPVAS